MMKAKILILCLFLITNISFSQKSTTRWEISEDGSITWDIKDKIPHYDHIEMSGKQVSTVLRYGINSDKGFKLNKSLIWPMLRTIPNDTHASLMRRFNWNPLDAILVNGRSLFDEKITQIAIKGKLTVQSTFSWRNTQFSLTREYFPSPENPALLEMYTISNNGDKPILIEIPETKNIYYTPKEKGVDGEYRIETRMVEAGSFWIKPKEKFNFSASIAAYKKDQPSVAYNISEEKEKREKLVDFWMNNLSFESPDKIINKMFSFSKIRALESIYETKGGPLHGPGGESYYAAIWANDQAEYINPYFPFTGYEYGEKSALNSYLLFSRYMNPEKKPIPSSIIAEGTDIWNGAGDRGDAAMIAYGASRYVLAKGSKEEAEKLWPLITWCLDYNKYKLNADGVVASDTDELEGRFKAGQANLSTSSLYYDALISASYLAKELGKPGSSSYKAEAEILKNNIEKYFGNKVENFDTYSYYKGNTVLRSWICIPLTMGIFDRAKGTIDALFSPRLWTDNGLLTEAGSTTFWDRSTLYALRGVYMAGETEKATTFLHKYSENRLLGEHVPYAIEAWPEGEQRHLSAESALYGRIVTEGIFGIRPTGFKSFSLTPRLPNEWDQMALRKIHAFGRNFDIEVKKLKDMMVEIKIIEGKKTNVFKIKQNKSINFKF